MAMYCIPETGGLLVDGVEESTGLTTDRGLGQGAGGLHGGGSSIAEDCCGMTLVY